jgi:endo-1,4-beta-xylanase
LRRLFLVAGLLCLTCAAGPPAASAQSASRAGEMMVKAGQLEAAARSDDRRAKRERRLARVALKRHLRVAARRHRARAKKLRKRARSRRLRAAGLRRRAAALSQVKAAVAAAPPRRAPVPLGTALDWRVVRGDPAVERVFLRDFDQMTPENALKMFALEPAAGVWDFREADELVDWARANGKRVRGHTLVYGNQLPDWLTGGDWSSDELLEVMRDHIKAVMSHFRGRVAEWDVVNEGVASGGEGLTPNIWARVIGPDYIDKAFEFAHEADPGAKLFYNDYGIELPDQPHTVAVRKLVSGLQSRGVPIDGVGIQDHVSSRYSASGGQLRETMRRFAALGLDVAITEMDVRMDSGGSHADELEAQRRAYHESAWACRMEPRCTSFSTWGISDRYSWITTPGLAPLMFDDELNPKPAFGDVEDWIRKP